MPIKKIIFRNLQGAGVNGVGMKSIYFYDKYGNIIPPGTLISSSAYRGEFDNFIIDSTHRGTNGMYIDKAFQNSNWYWVDNKAVVTVTCTFKNEINYISKITFIPRFKSGATILGVTIPFYIDIYNESNIVIQTYTITPLEVNNAIQTIPTGELLPIYKYLIKSNDNYYTFIDSNLNNINITNTPTYDDFNTYGINDLGVIPEEKWAELDQNPEILFFSTDTEYIPKLELSISEIKPYELLDNPSIVTYTESPTIPTLYQTVVAESKTRYLISNDKINYQVYRDGIWKTIDKSNIIEKGMTKTEIESITTDVWSDWFNNEAYKKSFDMIIGLYTENPVEDNILIRNVEVTFAENQGPLIENPVVSPDTVHNEWVDVRATIIDLENDQVQYQTYINGKQVYPKIEGTWSPLVNSGFNIVQAYKHPDFTSGDNSITIKVRDQRGLERDWTGHIVVTNSNPYVVYAYDEYGIICTIGDDETDSVTYRISINGTMIFDYPELQSSPRSFLYEFKPDELRYNEMNDIKIEIQDSYGGYDYEEFQILGVYRGLLFKDELGNYYTSDQGEILKILDKGNIIAGQNSAPAKVILYNNTNKSLKNVKIESDNGNLPPNVKVKLDTTITFLEPKDIIQIADIMGNKEEKEFYVSVRTSPGRGVVGGEFKVKAQGDIIDSGVIEYPELSDREPDFEHDFSLYLSDPDFEHTYNIKS